MSKPITDDGRVATRKELNAAKKESRLSRNCQHIITRTAYGTKWCAVCGVTLTKD